MFTKSKIVGVMVGLLVLSAPLVWADNGGDGDSGHQGGQWHQGCGWEHGRGDHILAKVLNLSDDQVKQLKDLRKKQWDARKATFEQIKANREAFNAEIVKAAPDMNKINNLQSQLKTIQGQLIDDHLNAILTIKKVLTPEQYAGYVALKKERKLMAHHRHFQFDHQNGFGKDKDGNHHWGDKSEEDRESDAQE